MDRPRQLFRDFGLSLALLLAAVLILWKTTLPALELNAELDREYLRLEDRKAEAQDELLWLHARQAAITDPIELEREHVRRFGALGLPGNEILVPDESGEPGAPILPDRPKRTAPTLRKSEPAGD